MAVYIPVRPRWNPRGEVVNYVSGGRLRARGWPAGYRDANTAAQRAQRGKMAQVCDVLPYLKPLLAEGYSPVVKRNGRRVGAYHTAVSVALREWFNATPNGYQLDTAKIRLTDGARALPVGLAVARRGGKVEITWQNGVARPGAKLLFAARLANTQEWVSLPVALEPASVGALVALPAHWAKRPAEVWIAFTGSSGHIKTKTLHCALSAAAAPPTPSPAPAKGHTVASVLCIARKGPANATTRRAGNPLKRPPNGCKFKLPGHCCVVKKGPTG